MDHLLQDITDALHASRPKKARRTYLVRTDDGSFPVLRLWREGFEVAEADAPRLRGHVDILEGKERIAICLIVLAKSENGIATYEFKRRTNDGAQSPADYAREENAPVALLI